MPITLDNLAAQLDPGRERLKGGQCHRAARYLLAPPQERLVKFGRVDAVQPDQLPGNNDGVAVDDLGGAGERVGSPTEPENCSETSRKAYQHPCGSLLPDLVSGEA
jgi:hypothetical protein